jgi:signal transduction histidine kinase
MMTGQRKPALLPWRLALLFLFLTVGIGAAGYSYLNVQQAHALREKHHDLAAIATLKTRQIADWRAERLAEAQSILTTSFIVSHAQHYLASGGRGEAEKQALLAWMSAPRHARHYRCVFLFDPAGEVRLTSCNGKLSPCKLTRPAVLDAMHTREVKFLDFHVVASAEKTHLSLFVPLLEETHGEKRVIGALAFEIDPAHFFYPLIQSRLTPSATAETLLVKREGDSVLYLNSLRHSQAAPLTLRHPLSDTAQPAVKAVLGTEGEFTGTDYRRVEVLAALRKVPGSPWFLVTKVDRAEVEAPLRDRLLLVAAICLLLIALTAFAVILLWRQQQMRFDLARHQFEEDLLHQANLELEKRVAERTLALRQEIAGHRQTEKALNESLEELSRSNADLEQFAYVASHDLQEPLRMVASFVQLLARRYRSQLDQDAREFIDYAVEGVMRMQRLINDQLSYALVGIDTRPLEMTDANAVLAEVLANLKPLIEENHAEISQDVLPMVPAIHSQFGQLLQNLVGNAIKFHGAETPRIHVSARREGDVWRFSVRDNGIGIERAYFEQIFLLFKRLHSREKYPGTGIGLAICKRIVERHHGRIWVESAPGKGATFYFTLPATLEEQAPL